MTQDTNTASGAADLPEALKHAEGLESFAEHLPAYGFDSKPLKEAAATIRRLHALLEAEDAAHCNTIEQRDEAEKLGTMLANAVAEHFRVEVGEYSNLNDPRLVALEILGGGYITDSDADRKIAALAAGQATAAQQGVAYAALPDDRESFKTYLKECDECAIVPDVAGAFNAAWQIATHGQAPAQTAPELTETAVTAKNPAAPVSSFEDSRTQAVYEVLVNDNYPPAGSNEHWEGWKARLIVDALFPIAAPAAVAGPSDAEPLHITHGPLMRHAAYLLRSRKPAWPEHESVAAELELAADGHPTPAGKPSPEWLEVAEAAMRAAAPTTQPAPQQEAQEPHGWLYEWTHSSATGKPDTTYTAFTTDEAHASKHDNCRAVYTAPQPLPASQGDALDAARYRYLRDGDWREHEKLESVIRLQLNTLWDETIDAARAAQEGKL